MKKLFSILVLCVVTACFFSACGKNESSGFGGEITVVSREDGSGTRDAFTELLEITDEDGNDITYEGAEITNSTSVMLATVSGNKRAIGYVSMGSVSDDVKILSVDNVSADTKNVKNGSYKVSRPFNICYIDGNQTDIAKDFESFVMSMQGQKIIEDEGYIPVDTDKSYEGKNLSGKLSLAGSTSVAPIMEIICDEYKKLNSGVTVEIQQSGSSAGISSAIEGVCDFAMSSRDLKESEKESLKQITIATDGIAVIVNKENPIENISSEDIKAIFSGEITDWSELEKVTE